MRQTDEEEVDRTRNPAAEREVIGTVIRAPLHAEEAMRLRAEDFTVPLHQVVWRAVAHLLDKGDPIRLQSVGAACGNSLDGQGRRDLEAMVMVAGGTEGILRDAIMHVNDATRRRAMPPSAMMAPASTKNGMASSENLLTPEAIWIITASSGRSIHSAPTSADRPSE